MYADQVKNYALSGETEAMPNHDGVGQALNQTRHALDSIEDVINGIETRLHGAAPRLVSGALGNKAEAQAEPGVLRLASDNANTAARLLDRLIKINATL